MKFWGHIISSEGIKADPEKVKAIQEMASTTNKRKVRRFMGMVNYLSKFSSKPLFDVIRQKSLWYWGINQQAAFESIKNELSKAPVLCSFDLRRIVEFRLMPVKRLLGQFSYKVQKVVLGSL